MPVRLYVRDGMSVCCFIRFLIEKHNQSNEQIQSHRLLKPNEQRAAAGRIYIRMKQQWATQLDVLVATTNVAGAVVAADTANEYKSSTKK